MRVWTRREKRLLFMSRRMGPTGAMSCDNESKQRARAASPSPALLSNSGSGKVTAAGIPASCLARTSKRLQSKRDIIQTLSPALGCGFFSFLRFSILFFSSLPLIFSSPKYVRGACAEQTWGANRRDQRRPNARNNRWICLLLSILHLLVSPCEPAGFGELSG